MKTTKVDQAEPKVEPVAKPSAEAVEGAVYPSPLAVLDERLKAVEEKLAVQQERIEALQPPHDSLDARLTALEKLTRSHAETIGNVKVKAK